jgi:uncharacterized membrane protein
MDPGLVIFQFLHVLGGSAWLGGSLFANAVILPHIVRQGPDEQRVLVARLLVGPERIMIGAALLAAITGLIRGTAFGPIQTADVLTSPYGLCWLASIVVAMAVFAVGATITSPALRRLSGDEDISAGARERETRSERREALTRVRMGFAMELAGILAILALMAALRVA